MSLSCALQEEDGADPKEIAEAEEDEEDFIMEEVKRRLKELRRNSFMVLIPEEEEEGGGGGEEDEEEEVGEGEPEWRDVEAEGRQWWGGFGAVYDDYCKRMLFFDRMSIQSGMFPKSMNQSKLVKSGCSYITLPLHFRS